MKNVLVILILSLFFCGNSYSKIITLDCKSLIKEQEQNLLYQTINIDTDKKLIDTGLGYNSPIIEETDKFFKAKHYGSDSETVYVDRYTGVVKIISVSKIGDQKKKYSLFDHFKCEVARKKF